MDDSNEKQSNTKKGDGLKFPDISYDEARNIILQPVPEEFRRSLDTIKDAQFALDEQFINSAYGYTVMDIARRYAIRSMDYITYNEEREKWFVFNGVVCAPAPSSFLLAMVRVVADGCAREAALLKKIGMGRLTRAWDLAFPGQNMSTDDKSYVGVPYGGIIFMIEDYLVRDRDRWGFSDADIEQLGRNFKSIASQLSRAEIAYDASIRTMSGRAPLSVLEFASKQAEIERKIKDYDSCLSDFVVLNGTIDTLKSPDEKGFFRESLPSDLNTMCADMSYRPGAECPESDKQFDRIFAHGDSERYRFFMKLFGGSLDASHPNKRIIMPHGVGQAGKSTLVESIRARFGTYGISLPSTAFIRDKNAGKNSPNVVLRALYCKRFATSSEPDSGGTLDEGLLKTLTSVDTQSARGNYEKELLEFASTTLVVMLVNERPKLSSNSPVIGTRLALSFCREIPVQERKDDKVMREVLYSERDGILNFLLRGLAMCKEDNWSFTLPGDMQTEVDDYIHSHNTMNDFIEQARVILDKDCREVGIACNELYSRYTAWYKGDPQYQKGKSNFNEYLVASGFPKKRIEEKVNGERNNEYYFIGIYDTAMINGALVPVYHKKPNDKSTSNGHSEVIDQSMSDDKLEEEAARALGPHLGSAVYVIDIEQPDAPPARLNARQMLDMIRDDFQSDNEANKEWTRATIREYLPKWRKLGVKHE